MTADTLVSIVAPLETGDAEAIMSMGLPTLASAGSHLTRLTTKGKHVPDELMDKVKELGK